MEKNSAKRKSSGNDYKKKPKFVKKKVDHESAPFSVPEFKVLLKNSASVFKAFERFNTESQVYAALTQKEKSRSYDLIDQYLRSSPECSEILLAVSDKDIYYKPESIHILTSFDLILSALLLEDYKKFFPQAAENICKALSEGHFTKIYNIVVSGRGKLGEVALSLLTTVASHGSMTTRFLYSSVTFTKEDVQALLTEKAVSMLRQPFIRLLLTIVKNASPPVLKSIIDEKGLLNGCFAKLSSDSPRLISFVLKTLNSKVLCSTSVTKTQRTRLFNETTIPRILECYEKRIDESTQREGGAEIKSLVCAFVATLLSDLKKGIVFNDPEFGHGERNFNHLVSLVLSKSILRSAYSDPALEGVVFSCLHSRPDQIHRYLSVLEESHLNIKQTETWSLAASHVVKLMYTLPAVDDFIAQPGKVKDDLLCNISLTLCTPPNSTLKIFKHVLSMPDLSWQYSSLGLILVCMSRAKAAMEYITKSCKEEKVQTWRSFFTDKFMQLMPNVDSILQCWANVNKVIKGTIKEPGVAIGNYASRVLEILLLFLELSPSAIHQSSTPINVSAILQDVENIPVGSEEQEDDMTNQHASIAVKALQLLSELTEDTTLSAMKTKKNKNTLGMVLKLIYGEADSETRLQAQQVITKQLQRTGWFEGLDSEIRIWFSYGDKIKSCDFLERMIQTLFSNPYPYYDQVQGLVNQARENKKWSQAVDEKPLPFSLLVTIAVKFYSQQDGKDTDGIDDYLCACLSEILLRQDDPLPLCILLSEQKILGLEGIAQTLLRTNKTSECQLKPREDLWSLLFESGYKEDKTLTDAVNICSNIYDPKAEETVALYSILALWHCEVDDLQPLSVAVGMLLSNLRHSIIPTKVLFSSGLVNRWYLSDDTDNPMTEHVTQLCNNLIGSLKGSDLKGLHNLTKTHRRRCREAVTSLSRSCERSDISLSLNSLINLCSLYSTSELIALINDILDIEKNVELSADYYTLCDSLYACVEVLYTNSVEDYSELQQRFTLISKVVNSELKTPDYKYKILLCMVTSCSSADMIPDSLWTECLTEIKSSHSESAIDLMTHLITETENQTILQQVAKGCSGGDKAISLLPVIKVLLLKNSELIEASGFSSFWSPVSLSLMEKLNEGDVSSCDTEIEVLQKLTPHVKSKHVKKLCDSLIDIPLCFSHPPLILLLLTVSEYQSRTVDVLSLIVDNVSQLHNSVVEMLGRELLTIKLEREEEHTEFMSFISDKWKNFVFTALRKNYESIIWIRLVSALVSLMYHQSSALPDVEVDLGVGDLFSLLMSHSKFLKLMLNTGSSFTDEECIHPAKGALLELLIQLVKLSPSVCEPDHFAIWLSSYKATMCDTDCQLLHLMYLYEINNVSTIKYRPYLWGSTGASHYSIKSNLTLTLSSQPSVDAVIECLDRELLHKSAYNFPLHRQLSPCGDNKLIESDGNKCDRELYDPSFILPLFAYVMRPDNTVNARLLISSGIITYTLCALSSHCADTRSAARFILYEFRSHLESSSLADTIQGLYVLDLLKESVGGENNRIHPIIGVFLAKTLQLIPDGHMYRVCHNYLLIKPRMELELVPEFYRLFYSSSPRFALERSWLLELLLLGLREDTDFRMYDKLNVFKIIMSYGQSTLCSQNDRNVIISVVEKACSLPSSHLHMIKYNILGWSANMIIRYADNTSSVLSSIKYLVSRCSAPGEDKSVNKYFLGQLVSSHISLLHHTRLSEEQLVISADILYQALSTLHKSGAKYDLSPHECEAVSKRLANIDCANLNKFLHRV